jgi:hypothetical protein
MTGRIRNLNEPSQPVKILGAASLDQQGQPQILDRNSSTQPPAGAEVVVHEELIVEDDKLRGRTSMPGDPQIRIRAASQDSWDKVKRLQS